MARIVNNIQRQLGSPYKLLTNRPFHETFLYTRNRPGGEDLYMFHLHGHKTSYYFCTGFAQRENFNDLYLAF